MADGKRATTALVCSMSSGFDESSETTMRTGRTLLFSMCSRHCSRRSVRCRVVMQTPNVAVTAFAVRGSLDDDEIAMVQSEIRGAPFATAHAVVREADAQRLRAGAHEEDAIARRVVGEAAGSGNNLPDRRVRIERIRALTRDLSE